MATKKPLVLVDGVPTGLPVGDTIAASDIEQDTNHQMITAAERDLIGTGGGGGITKATAISVAAAMAIALG